MLSSELVFNIRLKGVCEATTWCLDVLHLGTELYKRSLIPAERGFHCLQRRACDHSFGA